MPIKTIFRHSFSTLCRNMHIQRTSLASSSHQLAPEPVPQANPGPALEQAPRTTRSERAVWTTR